MTRSLSRRQFITGAAGAATLAGAASAGIWIGAGGGATSVAGPGAASLATAPDGDGTLVLCTLYGGNDGLNTVVPYEDPLYASLRGQLAYSPADVLPLADGLGLNKTMPKLKSLWDESKMAIVRGVAYPGLSFSHFQSMDTWQSADPSGSTNTGWLGRWLDATRTGPLEAISVGPVLPLAFTGERTQAAGITSVDMVLPGGQILAGDFAAMFAASADAAPAEQLAASSGSDLLQVIATLDKTVGRSTTSGAAASTDASTIAGQLDLVQRLIAAGLPSRAYGVSMTGFDTHSGEQPTQTRLLAELDAAVGTFMEALAGSAAGRKTVLVVYSEFGRRVAANASGGTDHGSANDVYIVGHGVRGGFYGEQPSLAKLVDGNLPVTTDFRSIYATIFGKVLGVDAQPFLTARFPTIDFL